MSIPGTDTARDVGIWTAAVVGILAAVRVLWKGLRALVHAEDMVKAHAAALERQDAQLAELKASLDKAVALADTVRRNVDRLDRHERIIEQLDAERTKVVLSSVPFVPDAPEATSP